jgi:hypothetical protein
MSYTIERLNNPNVYVTTLHADFVGEEVKPYYQELTELLDKEQSPLTVILNVREVPVVFENLLKITSESMRTEHQPYQHRNCKGLIIVSDDRLVNMSLDGFRKFGIAKNIQGARSMEAALALV